MNRVIKFRNAFLFKDGTFSHFTYWGAIDYKNEPSPDNGCFASPSANSGSFRQWHQQYTGLKDKAGKEIYEGDIIIAANDQVCEIKFGVWETYFSHENGIEGITGIGFSFNGGQPFQKSVGKPYEIIGNIYENADLLLPLPKGLTKGV